MPEFLKKKEGRIPHPHSRENPNKTTTMSWDDPITPSLEHPQNPKPCWNSTGRRNVRNLWEFRRVWEFGNGEHPPGLEGAEAEQDPVPLLPSPRAERLIPQNTSQEIQGLWKTGNEREIRERSWWAHRERGTGEWEMERWEWGEKERWEWGKKGKAGNGEGVGEIQTWERVQGIWERVQGIWAWKRC